MSFRDETKVCPRCEKRYGYVNCRVTFPEKGSLCLSCAIAKEAVDG